MAELEQAEKLLKDLETKYQIFAYNQQVVEKEISHLNRLKDALEQNIAVLANRYTIPLISEFKKARDDLARTQVRLNMHISDREKIIKTLTQLQDMINKGKEQYYIALRGLDGIVIKGNFGNRDGQEPTWTQN